METKRHQRTALGVALAAALALPATGLAQDAYDYTSVMLPGSVGSQAFGINERGQVAGNAFVDEGNIGFTYNVKKDRFDLVEDVAGFDITIISANSNRGDLVGSVVDVTAGVQSGLLLDKRGNAHVFGHPDAVNGTSARAINSSGTITGIRDSSDPDVILAGYIYDSRTETFTDIVPSALTIPQGINARGEVVGSAIFFTENDPCNPGAAPGGIVRYGWFRSDEGDVRFFTVNGSPASARGITDSGTIIGFTPGAESVGFVTGIPEGQCMDIGIGPEGLVAFPGANQTFAQSITNSGTVVGQYVDADGVQQTFIATPK